MEMGYDLSITDLKEIIARDLGLVSFDRSIEFIGENLNKTTTKSSAGILSGGFTSIIPSVAILGVLISGIKSNRPNDQNRKNYWALLKEEFRILLCTDDKKYADLRRKLVKNNDKSTTAVVSMISAAMAAHVGIVEGMLTPFCALCLIALEKLGREAYCRRTSFDLSV